MSEVKPIVIKNNESGEEYVLEFSRETVKFAESKGFSIDDVSNRPMTGIPELFYYSFRMHHKNISREKTDKILFDELGGLTKDAVARLGALYVAPFETLLVDEEDRPKNSRMTMEM